MRPRLSSLCVQPSPALYGTSDLHFITCSCYHRQAWLASQQRRDLFLTVFEEVRQRYDFVVVGYVAMPEHIHLLISEPEKGDPARVMQAIKQRFSRRVLKSVRKRRVSGQQELFAVGAEHVWQRRFYDFNLWTKHKRIEKLRYMHQNPVVRGLVQEAEQWRWSSYRSYAFGEAGGVRINQWGEAKLKIATPAA
ncbi:MAG TPA: transposase [Terriglobales bacterium]|nr:transposase [Terriglobales bacterium]